MSHELSNKERTFPCTLAVSETMRQNYARRSRTDFIHDGVWMAKWYECLVIVVVCGSIPGMAIGFFFLKAIENCFLLTVVSYEFRWYNKINLEAQFLIVKITEYK